MDTLHSQRYYEVLADTALLLAIKYEETRSDRALQDFGHYYFATYEPTTPSWEARLLKAIQFNLNWPHPVLFLIRIHFLWGNPDQVYELALRFVEILFSSHGPGMVYSNGMAAAAYHRACDLLLDSTAWTISAPTRKPSMEAKEYYDSICMVSKRSGNGTSATDLQYKTYADFLQERFAGSRDAPVKSLFTVQGCLLRTPPDSATILLKIHRMWQAPGEVYLLASFFQNMLLQMSPPHRLQPSCIAEVSYYHASLHTCRSIMWNDPQKALSAQKQAHQYFWEVRLSNHPTSTLANKHFKLLCRTYLKSLQLHFPVPSLLNYAASQLCREEIGHTLLGQYREGSTRLVT